MVRGQSKGNAVISGMDDEEIGKSLKGGIKYSLNHPMHPIYGIIYHKKLGDVIPITEEEFSSIILLAKEKRTAREFLIALKTLYSNSKYSSIIDTWMPSVRQNRVP